MTNTILEISNNQIQYLNQDGERHRLDGPAIEHSDGNKSWYQNGKRHRLDGPAIEYSNGNKEYWIEGKRLTKKEYVKKHMI